MPTYEYRCPTGHVFEKFYQKITAKRRVACPKCGKRAERLISGGARLVFKGSGFYATDYKRAGERKKSVDGGPSEEGGGAGEGGEGKPAETAKPKKDPSSSDK